jgi:iron(III) transport system permease protein
MAMTLRRSRWRRRPSGPAVLLVVVFALLACFLLYPIWCVVRSALIDAQGVPTAEHLVDVFRNRLYREGLVNSLVLASATTAVVLLLGLPLAVIADRFDFAGKRWLTGLVLVPLVLPPFVGAIGMRQIFGRYGGSLNVLLVQLGVLGSAEQIDWLGEWRLLGIIVVEALHLYPILYLNAVAALANIDPTLAEAARNLGASPWRVFRRVSLPLMLPGLFAGTTIVFIFSFTELGTPLLFEYRRVTAVQIFDGLEEVSTSPMPFALIVVMLATTLVLYAVSKLFLGRRRDVAVVKAMRAGQARRLSRPVGLLAAAPFAVVTALAIVPHLGVVFTSLAERWVGTILPARWTLAHYASALGHSLAVPSITNSLRYASLAVCVDLVLGLAIAYLVVRTRLPGRHVVDALAMLPLAVPGLVIAFGYVAMSSHRWLVGLAEWSGVGWLDLSKNPTLFLVIAYAVRRLPYVVRSLSAGLEQLAVGLEEAAYNLGASTARVLRKVTIPLIAPNMIAGGLLAFSFAVLEVSDSLVLAQRTQDYPVTKAIFDLYQRLGDGPAIASALGVWAMLLLSATLLAASLILGRRLGALFRT